MEEVIKKAIEGGYRFKDIHFPKGDPFGMGGGTCSFEGNKIITRKDDGEWRSESFLRMKDIDWKSAYLDPLFWQALGKSLGWGGLMFCPVCGSGLGCDADEKFSKKWEYQMHRFIDHLIEGKDADSFFKELLTNK